MQAVILAAGKSTRTYPLTLTRPKALLPLMNKPILAHQLDALAGIVDEAVVVVGYLSDMIREHFGARYGDIALEYVDQGEQLGTGHALLQCADRVTGGFLVLNGDDLFDAGDLARLAEIDQGGLAHTVDDPSQFGVYVVDESGRVKQIVEKPTEPISNLTNAGAYKFSQEVFAALEGISSSARGEIELTSAIQVLADNNAYGLVEATGRWLPVGYPWDVLKVNSYLLDHDLREDIQGEVSSAAHLNGVISVGRGTVIRPGVVIDGPVCIGENCMIGPNAWIRPYSTIGDECRVGQGTEIKASVLLRGAKVPHLSYIGDSVLGENTNIGCGTITANLRHDNANQRSSVRDALVDTGLRKFGAIMGDNVHTGINTSIYPGRKLWPGTGTRPGEIVDRDKLS